MFLPFKKLIKKRLESFIRYICRSELQNFDSWFCGIEQRMSGFNERFAQSEKIMHSISFENSQEMSKMARMLMENVECRLSLRQKKKGVVYTCLTGDYDEFPLHDYLHLDYDYVCFTDNERFLRFGRYGVWQIRPLAFSKLDNVRNSRWHKVHPHVLKYILRDEKENNIISFVDVAQSSCDLNMVKANVNKIIGPEGAENTGSLSIVFRAPKASQI